jgi:hypothetical protein
MLLVPVPEVPSGLGSALQTLGSNIQIQLTIVLDRQEKPVMTAFTDVEALRNWDPNTPYLGIKAQELFRLVMQSDAQEIAINPYDPIRKMIRPGGRVTRAEMDLLANGVVPSRIGPKHAQFQLKANEKVFIEKPATPPSTAVEELLRSKARDLTEIAGLYVFQMATHSGSSHTVIGIQLRALVSSKREQEISATLGKAVMSELGPGQSLDFMLLRGSLGDQVRALGGPIFLRS